MNPTFDIAIVGAGAAGLAAAIFAGEEAQRLGAHLKIALIDGAKKPGAKILVSGGGRCNVTNTQVTSEDYCGGSQKIIRNVLRSFDEQQTVRWMESLGVPLKLEPTGKYFPESNSSRTVLEALMRRVDEVGVQKLFGFRVSNIRPPVENQPNDSRAAWQLTNATDNSTITARTLVIATGGRALPKSGSDGAAYPWLKRLGHTIITPVPALAPLVLDDRGFPDSPLSTAFADLAGITINARLAFVVEGEGCVAEFSGSLLFTHFGLSGPAAMNLSRHIARHRQANPGRDPGYLVLGLPQFYGLTSRQSRRYHSEANAWLLGQIEQRPRAGISGAIATVLPERMAICISSSVSASRMADLTREERLRLAQLLTRSPLAVKGDRGYSFAEATAGGVALDEINWRTMTSRKVEALHLCGEVLDVDGRIGGFNFQWAWSSAYRAGRAAVHALANG